MKKRNSYNIIKMLGIESSNTSFYEKIISSFGSMLGIYFSFFITRLALGTSLVSVDNSGIDLSQSHLLFASLGATSVLIFVTPHSALSQPWNVVGGHFLSAVMGYVALSFVADITIASALAVGGAILVMYLTRSIHPPGGATALFVVLTGHSTLNFNTSLIFEILTMNIAVILLIGVIFNNVFYWRRYPSYFYLRYVDSPKNSSSLSQEDFSAALIHLDSYIDVSAEELSLIFDLALENANHHMVKANIPLQPSCFYSNAALGKYWSVRQVLDIDNKRVNYQTVVGSGISENASCSLKEFQKWAKLEVKSENNTWVKKDTLFKKNVRDPV